MMFFVSFVAWDLGLFRWVSKGSLVMFGGCVFFIFGFGMVFLSWFLNGF